MFAEIGLYALILALCFSVSQVVLGTYGVFQKHSAVLAAAPVCAYGQFYFVLLSFITLAIAFIANDFSIAYVAENSNTALSWVYRVCAVWGAHEGSMLLWVFILSVWTTLVAYKGRFLAPETLARILVIMGLVAIGFYIFILATSNPFLRLLPHIPLNGRDLNPLLQDPGLVSHPPILYIGYVGMVVPFAFAIAALWQGHFDSQWASWVRPWTTLAWSFLTLGIVLGSWWAYRELGWGGWWFWDPVENASFLPWLAATALVHSLMVTEKRTAFKNWTVLLAICAFSLSLIGTFLVRSGVLISVHAFASDPERGAFILKFLFLMIGLSFALYAWRNQRLVKKESVSVWSREGFLLANNMLLFVSMLTVLLGTLYPLLADVLHWGKISVGAPYFNAVFIPLMVPLVFLMGMAPFFYWEYRDPRSAVKPMVIIFIVTVIAGYCTVIWLSLAIWLFMTLLYYIFNYKIAWRRSGMLCAHGGMAIMIVGIVLSHAYSEERDLRMHVGETATLGAYTFQLQAIRTIPGAHYDTQQAHIAVMDMRTQHTRCVLYPEYRWYHRAGSPLSKTDIAVSWRRDLYVALGSAYQDGSWSVRIYIKPFVRWIWSGGLLMVLGGLIAVIL